MTSFAGLRPVEEQDLELLLSWRNHPSVRRFMYTQHEITMDEHRAWYARVSKDPASRLLLYCEAVPCGYVQLSLYGHRADWGFYIAPDAPRGTGSRLGKAALDYCFDELELQKVSGEAIDYNEASIAFHQKLGFVQEGRLRQQHKIGTNFHDVIYFGLLKTEWYTRRDE